MKTIALVTSASYDVLDALREILKDTWVLEEVRMDYDIYHLPDDWNLNTYPVTLVFNDSKTGRKTKVKIFALSVGYGGTGPRNFAELLDFFGIKYEENDIYTKRCVEKDGFIHLKYVPK